MTLQGLAQGRRPQAMADDEALLFDFCDELMKNQGVSEGTYAQAVREWGEQGVIDLLATLGYFITVSMIMNVAHTPSPAGSTSLEPFPP
jgi:4-carboxymuconolactone decarboxylase